MTVMDLVCDEVRMLSHGSRFLELEVTLAECDTFFHRVLTEVAAPPTFRMRYTGLSTSGGIRMDLAPADKETHASIHAYRDAVATATGVRFPNHETYGFHITLAYRLMEPPSGEAEEIASWVNEVDPTLHATFGIYDTGKPRFALFDDMVRFVGMDERATLRPR